MKNTLTLQAIQDALRMLEAPRVKIDFIVIHPYDTLTVFRLLRRGGYTLTRWGIGRIYVVKDRGVYVSKIYIPRPEFSGGMERGKFIPIPEEALQWPKIKASGGFS
jgi:uncharacterized membrane protein